MSLKSIQYTLTSHYYHYVEHLQFTVNQESRFTTIYLHCGIDKVFQWRYVVRVGEHGEDSGEMKVTTNQTLKVDQNVYSREERETQNKTEVLYCSILAIVQSLKE